jgi:ATP phosphoribosyltransferase
MKRSATVLTLAALAAFAALGGCAGMAPPNEEIVRSQAAVSKAEGAQAYQFAPVEFQAAQEKLQRARSAMRDEEYETAKRLAEQAEVDANVAYSKARTAQSMKAVEQLQKDIQVLERELGS